MTGRSADAETDAVTEPRWWAYVLVAVGRGRTYIGVTDDPERRLAQHNGKLPGGAKSTRAGRPWRLGRAFGPFDGRGDAQSAEYRLKRLPRVVRMRLVDEGTLVADAMAWTKIPKAHHELMHAALPDDARASTLEMFGGVAVMVNGNMAGGLWAESIVVRLAPKDWARAAKLGGEPFVPMGRAVMKDMIVLPKGTLDKQAETQAWLQLAIDFTSLMPKKKAAKKKAAKKKAAKKKAAKKKAAKKK